MEFGPIFRTLARNKTRFILIGLEVALTLAIVVNCVNMMLTMKNDMDRPTGLDEGNIITIRSQPFAADFKEKTYLNNARKADLDLLRAIPGVRAADAFSAIPLSGSGSSSGFKPLGAQMNTIPSGIFTTGTDGISVLGVQLIAGRNLRPEDINESDSKNVIVTKAFADKLFPEGSALGKQIQGRTPENPDTIVGIIERMHGSWPRWPYVGHVTLRPGEPGNFNYGVRYMVRVDPRRAEGMIKIMEAELLRANNGRNIQIQTLSEIKAHSFEDQSNIITMLACVILLLVFVTALGIVGITSFSVTERIHHIGTRRALGARKVDILRYFLTENWLITTLGLLLGIGLTYGLNYLLVTMVSGAKMDWRLVITGVAGMWIIGQLAALLPAWRGARISPSVATRTV